MKELSTEGGYQVHVVLCSIIQFERTSFFKSAESYYRRALHSRLRATFHPVIHFRCWWHLNFEPSRFPNLSHQPILVKLVDFLGEVLCAFHIGCFCICKWVSWAEFSLLLIDRESVTEHIRTTHEPLFLINPKVLSKLLDFPLLEITAPPMHLRSWCLRKCWASLLILQTWKWIRFAILQFHR